MPNSGGTLHKSLVCKEMNGWQPWQDCHWPEGLSYVGRLSYYDEYVEADTEEGPPVPICADERPILDGTDQC
jgi:hypothetical protein